MFGQDRDQLRRFFRVSWDKRRNGQALQPLERLVSQVIEQHPEYQRHIEDEALMEKDFSPDHGETNPWLHMGMHISLGEQLAADRPGGIRDAYQAIATRMGEAHAAEHAMMECLGMILWEAQRSGSAPDEQAYLKCLTRLGR